MLAQEGTSRYLKGHQDHVDSFYEQELHGKNIDSALHLKSGSICFVPFLISARDTKTKTAYTAQPASAPQIALRHC